MYGSDLDFASLGCSKFDLVEIVDSFFVDSEVLFPAMCCFSFQFHRTLIRY